ncbi:MAG: DUF362 domain-containing protein [Clostridia bacterium]|nr:DUF362 domain-containing protein [Clostridia bacterium]
MVVIEKCASYDRDAVKTAVMAIFDACGGIEKLVGPGTKVALKPNLVAKRKPEEAATTHPAVLQAVAELCAEAGGIVTVCESPGGVYDKTILKGLYKGTGIEDAALAAGAELNYDLSVTKVDNPEAMFQKTPEILTPLAEADVVINLAKLKTHGMMVYTGAVKNLFGAIPGIGKAEYHFKMPDYASFANTVIDIFLAVKPAFSIIDSVVGMHKDGPTAGEPFEAGLLLGGANAFEVDRVALDLISARTERVPMAKEAISRGLMPADIDEVELAGDISLAEARKRLSGFVVKYNDDCSRLHFSDGFLGKIMSKMVKPKPVFTKKCRSCGECARLCPVKAITVEKGKRAKADLDKCIRCYCCQELCRFKAVKIKKSAITKLAQKL